MIAVEASRDLIHADGLYAAIDGPADAQFFLDLVVGEQVGALPGEARPDAVEEGFETRSLKIGSCLFTDRVGHG